ncbi:hypothetical protein MBLNU459_g7842t1 [Dothideomycetes sp. NU459]
MAFFSPAYFPHQDFTFFKNRNAKQTKNTFDSGWFTHNAFHPTHARNTITPVFDIRETRHAYFLEGELPGVADKSDIKLEWKGDRTLVLESAVFKTDLEREWGVDLSSTESDASSEDGGPVHRTEKHDEIEQLAKQLVRANSESSSTKNGAKDGAAAAASARPSNKRNASFKYNGPKVKIWTSERHVGHFSRSFAFPDEVVPESLKARLNQGLLKITVTKATQEKSIQVPIEMGE